MADHRSTTRRRFLKGGLLGTALSFVNFGPLGARAGTGPSAAKILAEKAIPIPSDMRSSIYAGRDFLKARGFTVPIVAAKRLRIRTVDGLRSAVKFDSRSLEETDRRASLAAVKSDILSAVVVSVATWDGTALRRLEVYEVVDGEVIMRLDGTFAGGKLDARFVNGLDDAEIDAARRFFEWMQNTIDEVAEAGELNCCDCVRMYEGAQVLVCGLLAIGCALFVWPLNAICSVIWVQACFIVDLNCEDKCQLCGSTCFHGEDCYLCC